MKGIGIIMRKKITALFVLYIIILLCPLPDTYAASPGKFALSQGLYEITSVQETRLVLDIRSCAWAEEEPDTLQLYETLDVNQQKFYFESLPGDVWRISALSSGKALTAGEDSGDRPEASLSLETLRRSNGHAVLKTQRWYLQDAGDGNCYIRSGSGKYLTAEASYPYNGASLALEDFTGKRNQQWNLRKTWISDQDTADTDLPNPYKPLGKYAHKRFSIRFGSRSEQLTGETLAGWMTETEEHQLWLDTSQVRAYVEDLAARYDNLGQPLNFTTTGGETRAFANSDMGWMMDVEQTYARLLEALQNPDGENAVTPVWSHEGFSFDKENEIGGSYVEVDMTRQKAWLYKDGEQLLETDVVTGTLGDPDRQTPEGLYAIYYMQSPAVLRGADYTSPVDYWMAYYGNYGLHDAQWRNVFGGEIYTYDGSHGCVNLPTEAAKLIYETVSYGFPVITYY